MNENTNKCSLKGAILNPEAIYGKSAYELDVEAGYTGTKEEWLKEVRGDFDEKVEKAKTEFNIEVDTVIIPRAKAELVRTKEDAVAELEDYTSESQKVLEEALNLLEEKEALLWGNDDTSESFVSQTVDISANLTSEMERIKIVFLDQESYTLPSVEIERGQSGRISYVDRFEGDDGGVVTIARIRLFTFNLNGTVSFDNAYPGNNYCIPYKIYGVKNEENSTPVLVAMAEAAANRAEQVESNIEQMIDELYHNQVAPPYDELENSVFLETPTYEML